VSSGWSLPTTIATLSVRLVDAATRKGNLAAAKSGARDSDGVSLSSERSGAQGTARGASRRNRERRLVFIDREQVLHELIDLLRGVRPFR
jgi:hypothetical protein